MEIFVSQQVVLVLAVWVSVSGLFRNHEGEGEITTVDIASIVLSQIIPAAFEALCILFLIIIQ
jgi:hypothetical protein